MKTILKLSLLALLFLPVAQAQGPLVAGMGPVVEAGVGYSYTKADLPSGSNLGMNGVQLIGNADFTKRLGIKAEVGYSRSFDVFSSGHSADLLTYMAGPVFYPVRNTKMNVFAHILLGGARETGVNYEANGQIVLGFVNKFAWAGGGGFQYRISRSLSIRTGVDYLRTSYFDSTIAVKGQTNLRPSVSLIYTFGERE